MQNVRKCFAKKIQSHFQIEVDCFQSFFQCYAMDKDGLRNYNKKNTILSQKIMQQ